MAIAIAALAALGARPAARAWEKYERAQWHKKVLATYNQLKLQRDDEPPPLVLPEHESGDDSEEDDATIRRLYTLAYYGNHATPDVSEQRFNAIMRESARWSTMLGARTKSGAQPNAVVSGQSWVNLGPTDTRIEKNGSVYNGIDSGRAATIRVDPRSKDVVYVATAWGGVWKTYNFTATQPQWSPISDTIGGLIVGAFEIDPNNPDTLYLGIGDALDTSVAGGAMFKSTDGGGTWTMLTARLSGAYPAAAGARTESAVAIRDIGIDKSDSNKLLVATDIGLFRSIDAGAHFTLVPLPDAAGGQTLEQEVWTIAYLGAAGAQSAWVVSGVDACATNQAPLGFGLNEPAGATTPVA
ncbi:MAG: WD40/YVTN/BNR-like repeat-containing protein, partial [Polyangia bacterium]